MRIFIIKVHQYKDGEGYEGYFLVISCTLGDAINKVKETKEYKEVERYGGDITLEQTTLYEIRNWNMNSVHLLCWDNYN